jgi:hypothetical protein
MFRLFLVARPSTFIAISGPFNKAYRMVGGTRLAITKTQDSTDKTTTQTLCARIISVFGFFYPFVRHKRA